jgi:SAM-dependent methyltransferase
VSLFSQDSCREYWRCANCQLIFVPPTYHLSRSEEKAQYDLHQNSPDDQGYRRFLTRIFEPVHDRLTAGSKGLDFGSGPGPTLSVMFEEVGYQMKLYDTFYAPDQAVLYDQYDFVTASEVVEHFRKPKEELKRLLSCVKPGGLLGIMTKLALDREAFESWHYKNDPTHLSFFSQETFQWLADKWNADLTFSGSDVILMSLAKTNDRGAFGSSP